MSRANSQQSTTSAAFGLHQGQNDIAAREKLLECLQAEKAAFLQLAESFYAETKSDEQMIQLCHTIIETVNRVESAGDWEASLFLRNTIAPLKEIREEAREVLQQMDPNARVATDLKYQQLGEDAVKVYVSLYQTDGNNLNQWALQLKTLSRYIVGRPIYQDETAVQKVIRARNSQAQEAYVVVAVNKGDVLPSLGAKSQDRLGSELVNLSEGAITSNNIIEFVHQNKHYDFRESQLRLRI